MHPNQEHSQVDIQEDSYLFNSLLRNRSAYAYSVGSANLVNIYILTRHKFLENIGISQIKPVSGVRKFSDYARCNVPM